MYEVAFTYDVEDDFDGETVTTTIEEERTFLRWDDVIAYRDELRSCPWITNVTFTDISSYI